MLVLTRKQGESLEFPGLGIRLSVERVRGGRVRLGIQAPEDVLVMRSELPHKDVAQVGESRSVTADGV